jgi:hypothetical protein
MISVPHDNENESYYHSKILKIYASLNRHATEPTVIRHILPIYALFNLLKPSGYFTYHEV